MAKLAHNKKNSIPKTSAKKTQKKATKVETESSGSESLSEENTDNADSSDNNKKKSTFLSECKLNFNTQDLYEVLSLNKKTATQTEIKKAYYKLSLRYHPDKVTDKSLEEQSKTKFQILGKIYSLLSDEDKRKLYDESGLIDGEDDNDSTSDWRQFFKISTADIEQFFSTYKSSDEERDDLFRIYASTRGDMNSILEQMFSSDVIEDEPRFREILERAIESKQIEAYDSFVKESKRKATKRKAHYQQEAKEAEELKKEMGIENDDELSLHKAIMSRMGSRKVESDNFLDQLEKKYAAKEKQSSTKKKSEPTFKLDQAQVVTEASDSDDDDDDDDDEFTDASRKPRSKKAKSGGKRLNVKSSKVKSVKRNS
jgi:DnaJ family protein C protein 9